jgi:mRNA interferase HicA
MKRAKLLQHLCRHGCEVVGEGRRHTRVRNPANGNRSVVPRHSEIGPGLVREVCKQLEVPPPEEK